MLSERIQKLIVSAAVAVLMFVAIGVIIVVSRGDYKSADAITGALVSIVVGAAMFLRKRVEKSDAE
ncbi:MAG: hypothetical protein QM775_16730 [Pirellulales bacterium]